MRFMDMPLKDQRTALLCVARGVPRGGGAGKLIAALLAVLLRFASSRAIMEDTVTLAFGARMHRGSPPAEGAIESAGGLSQSVDDHTTIWLKPSNKSHRACQTYTDNAADCCAR
jgi:hypothetical protein